MTNLTLKIDKNALKEHFYTLPLGSSFFGFFGEKSKIPIFVKNWDFSENRGIRDFQGILAAGQKIFFLKKKILACGRKFPFFKIGV